MKFLLSLSILVLVLYTINIYAEEKLQYLPSKDNLCQCQHQGFSRFLPKFINAIFGQRCKCNQESKSSLKCSNGKFNGIRNKCICDQCWFGKTCSELKTKYKPKFQKKTIHLKVSEETVNNGYLASLGDFNVNACHGKCPCGGTIYLIDGQNENFVVGRFTGEIHVTKENLPLKRYRFNVVSYNLRAYDENQKSNRIKVVVAIDHAVVAIDHAGLSEAHSANEVHSRKRREESAPSHPLVISATPYLKEKYYFNIGDEIVFRIRATHNSTGDNQDIDDTVVTLKSTWLTISNPVKNSFDITESRGVEGWVAFNITKLTTGQSVDGNLTGTVKSDIGPLSSLDLELSATSKYSDEVITVSSQKSSPVVYAVFPEVNLTREHDQAVAVYDQLDMNMHLNLPRLNYSLTIELTTNIEEYVFMSIENVVVTVDAGVIFNGSTTPKSFSSQANDEIDRVTIDLGFINIPNDLSDDMRNVNIKYTIKVNDHPDVATNSIHWMGVGLQAGEKILWVEQQSIEIVKIEPALQISVTTSATNYTRLLINDTVTFKYTIEHADTSQAVANNVQLSILTANLKISNTFGPFAIDGSSKKYEKLNDTFYKILWDKQNPFGVDMANGDASHQQRSDEIEMVVRDNISPFMELPIKFIVTYENQGEKKKRPLIYNAPAPLTGTPSIKLSLDGSLNVTAGMKRYFTVIITLVKMVSPLQVELVMQEINNMSLLTITSFNLKSVGANIIQVAPSQQPQLFATTEDIKIYDQAAMDLGTLKNINANTSDIPDNQIVVEFEAVVNEHSNITNGSSIEVGAGVIASPRMVWVDKIDLKGYIVDYARPHLNFTYQMINESEDIFELSLEVNHMDILSSQFAYNVSFEFYLTPYVVFDKHINKTGNLIIQSDTSFKIDKLYFTDSISATIQVKLDRSKSSQEGTFNFSLPVRVTYYNGNETKWQYFKTLYRSIKVLPRFVLIQVPQAVPDYYGRGMLVVRPTDLGTDLRIYLCMNQHAISAKSACFYSPNYGAGWRAMDNRFGSVLLHGTDNNIYGVSRNGDHYVEYDSKLDDCFGLRDKKFTPGQFKNLENATYVELKPDTVIDDRHKVTIDNHEIAGAGDGLYYRSGSTKPWILRAKWMK